MGAPFDPGVELGPRLRQVREERGLSVRELARRLTCSASLISQIERGLSAPSVAMLYALATELRTSTDFLFGVTPATVHGDARDPGDYWGGNGAAPSRRGQVRHGPAGDGARPAARGPGEDGPPGAGGGTRSGAPRSPHPTGHGIVQRMATRRTIDLASGVRWERLTPGADDRVDFLEVIYEPSGHSTDTRRLLRHDGQEYGLILLGTLRATVGFETYELGPGDSIAFDSSVPHEYWNPTRDNVHAVWVVVHAEPGRA